MIDRSNHWVIKFVFLSVLVQYAFLIVVTLNINDVHCGVLIKNVCFSVECVKIMVHFCLVVYELTALDQQPLCNQRECMWQLLCNVL